MHVHIIAFEIPYPANYGGAIDVFYSIMALRNAGVDITLHCFHKNTRKPHPILRELCREVYYYERDMRVRNQFAIKPFSVMSRRSEDLIQNLLKDDDPILYETLAVCHSLSDKRLANRLKVYRESNVEHDYYNGLARAEYDLMRKIYYRIEAIKNKWFEPQIRHAQALAVVSLADDAYFKQHYANVPCFFIPSFHEEIDEEPMLGTGDYVLYHGNLMVPENEQAAQYVCCEIAPLLPDVRFVIAGLNPRDKLCRLIDKQDNVQLVKSPEQSEMEHLIRNAHINLLLTFQSTGIKLKLLNTMRQGRHIVANRQMLCGTGMDALCHQANTIEEQVQTIAQLMKKPFTKAESHSRTNILKSYSNEALTQQLLSLLHQGSCDQS
ncbi:MAG: glycosyltransferase [Paludibacteraceae bacterium]|nr:glycosyltransferase [Paludibacteraceae bacterium]